LFSDLTPDLDSGHPQIHVKTVQNFPTSRLRNSKSCLLFCYITGTVIHQPQILAGSFLAFWTHLKRFVCSGNNLDLATLQCLKQVPNIPIPNGGEQYWSLNDSHGITKKHTSKTTDSRFYPSTDHPWRPKSIRFFLLMVQKSGESPVDMVNICKYPHNLQGFTHVRWFARFLNHQQYNRLCCTSGCTQTAASPKMVSGRVVATGMNSLAGCWCFGAMGSCKKMVKKNTALLACCKETSCLFQNACFETSLCASEKYMLRRVLIIFDSSSKTRGQWVRSCNCDHRAFMALDCFVRLANFSELFLHSRAMLEVCTPPYRWLVLKQTRIYDKPTAKS